ncbi:MAG: septal ring lytic transglycosylase RlpA family protein [Betaproteobacteria bacterium]|nr:septal ring lytic transglycosylase RlpA family protein [Betaproteobacteria bacterium]
METRDLTPILDGYRFAPPILRQSPPPRARGDVVVVGALLFAWFLAGCASKPAPEGKAPSPPRPGAYYADDGPGANPPPNLEQLADALPRWEPLHRFANRPYTVLGRDYVPATELRPYRERGIATWYGRKFHARRTSVGENYDMYAMTAAHPTLPLPSYARVTNLANGRSVVVRVNDRGPFLHGRLIDLSYAAAFKLGYVNQGSAQVEVEAVLPDAPGLFAARAPAPAALLLPGVAQATGAVQPVAPAQWAGQTSPAAGIERNVPLRTEDGQLFLQLGAFSNLDNAENYLALMEFQLSGSGNSGGEIVYAPRIRARDNMFRVELGPYASRSDAQRAALELESRFGVVPSAQPR